MSEWALYGFAALGALAALSGLALLGMVLLIIFNDRWLRRF